MWGCCVCGQSDDGRAIALRRLSGCRSERFQGEEARNAPLGG